MPWDTAFSNWPAILRKLCADFPHLDQTAASRFRGDRWKLVVYLAETHDLTEREAEETLADWLMFRAPLVLRAAA